MKRALNTSEQAIKELISMRKEINFKIQNSAGILKCTKMWQS
jgi:hypothetical protein